MLFRYFEGRSRRPILNRTPSRTLLFHSLKSDACRSTTLDKVNCKLYRLFYSCDTHNNLIVILPGSDPKAKFRSEAPANRVQKYEKWPRSERGAPQGLSFSSLLLKMSLKLLFGDIFSSGQIK